jgi:hypothetical protein
VISSLDNFKFSETLALKPEPMNSETTITYVSADSSAQDSVGSTVVSLSVKGDPTETAAVLDEFLADLHHREFDMTSTLEHILQDAHAYREPLRHLEN